MVSFAALIHEAANKAGIKCSLGDARKVATAAGELMIKKFATQDCVIGVGAGRLRCTTRKARMGRNPQTGARLMIPAKRAIKFSASKDLKERLAKVKVR